MMACLDASVIAKWYFEEERADQARVLQRAYLNGSLEPVAPDILPYECASVVRRKSGQGACTADVAHSTLRQMLRVEWWFIPGVRFVERALELSLLRRGLGSYDAAYVAVAEWLDVDLWTADKKLARACADLPFVKLLGRDQLRHSDTSDAEAGP